MTELDPANRLRVLVSPAAGAIAAGSLLVLILTAGLHVGLERSAWHLDIDSGLRVAILVNAIWQSWPLMAVIGCLAALATVQRPWLRRLAIAGAAFIIFLWLASWSVFWATGQFLEGDSVALALASPGSMFLHVVDLAAITLVVVPVACVLVTAVLLFSARLVARAALKWRASALASAIVLVVFAGILDSIAASQARNSDAHVMHPEGGTPIQARDLYELLRRDRSGPIARIGASVMAGVIASEVSSNVAVEWPDRTAYTAHAPIRRYNVVVLVIESLRSDELKAYGSELSVMPAVDRVAEESTVFLDHYAVATHSNYSSVSPISSQYPLRDARMHVYPKEIPYARILLYDVLKPFGYRTAIVSSQNEEWGGMANFLASERLDHFFHAGTYTGETYLPEQDVGFAKYALKYGRSGKIDDAKTIDEAIRWIGNDSTAAPFVIYINLQNSHVPYPIPADAPTPFGPRKPSFSIGFNYFPRDSAQVVRGVYRNALHYVDAQIARFIDHLRSTGQLANTILVLAGDHGQAFYEHGFAAHANELYEELLRTPLIIRAPGMTPGRRSGLLQHVDIAPTILDLLGLPPHPGFQGQSAARGARRFAYAVVQSPMANQYGIVHGKTKLVIDARTGRAVLRDLSADPSERVDAAGRNQEELARLRERLDTWHAVQLEYYADARLQAKVYAPVLPEVGRLSAADSRSSGR